MNNSLTLLDYHFFVAFFLLIFEVSTDKQKFKNKMSLGLNSNYLALIMIIVKS